MKRYECTGYYKDGDMHECHNGQWYSRTDLIAAGVLVPVPDGEAVTISETRKRRKFLYNGRIYMKQAGMFVNDEGNCVRIDREEIVQPVRLVPLEDVE